MVTFGIDVSKHQGSTIDWHRVKASGISFAFSRAMICTLPDYTFRSNVTRMREAGLIPGAYHFLYGSSWASPEEQADRFMDLVGDPEGMLIALDVESDGTSRPTARDAERWVARFRSRYPDHPVLLYTGRWYWVGVLRNPRGGHIAPLWHSRYVSNEGLSPKALYDRYVIADYWRVDFGGWRTPLLIQFTSSASVPGIVGRVDANAFLGTARQLESLSRSTPLPDTSTEVDHVSIYEKRPVSGRLTIKAGTTPRAWQPKADGSGWEVAKAWEARTEDSSAPFDYMLARISGTLTPSSLLHVPEGWAAGLYISTADVEEVTFPTDAEQIIAEQAATIAALKTDLSAALVERDAVQAKLSKVDALRRLIREWLGLD